MACAEEWMVWMIVHACGDDSVWIDGFAHDAQPSFAERVPKTSGDGEVVNHATEFDGELEEMTWPGFDQ